MIAQQELQHLLSLPDQEKISLAHRLLESLVKKQSVASEPSSSSVALPAAEPGEENDIHPSAKWLLSMAGMYSGGPGDTGERADEICAAEIKKRSGFTLKEELPD